MRNSSASPEMTSRSARIHRGLGAASATERPVTKLWLACMSIGFAFFFCPASYAVPRSVYSLWMVCVIVVSAIAVLLVLLRCRMTLRWLSLVVGCLFYYFLSAAFGQGGESAANCLYNASRLIGLSSLLEYGLERDQRATLLSFLTAGVALCCVNFATVLQYHGVVGGMRNGYVPYGRTLQSTQNWYFFSHDNGTLFFYFPVIACLWYYALKYSRKVVAFAVLFTALTLFMYLMLWSAAAMVVVGAFLAVMILCCGNRLGGLVSRLNYRMVLFFGIAFSVVVVVLNISGSFDYFASLLGKTGTAGTRATIWRDSISWIASSPVTGVGYEPDLASIMRIGINHCHNILLQLAYTGGLITVFPFAAFAWLCRPKGRPGANAFPLLVYVLLIFIGWTFDFYLYMSVTVVPFVLLARSCDQNLREP
jgi:O-antigen ligase